MRKNLWTEDEIRILKNYFPNSKISFLKKLLPKKSQTGIYRKARELGLKRRPECWSIWRKEEAKIRHHNQALPRIFSPEITSWLIEMDRNLEGGLPSEYKISQET